jgi:hypothetical protein
MNDGAPIRKERVEGYLSQVAQGGYPDCLVFLVEQEESKEYVMRRPSGEVCLGTEFGAALKACKAIVRAVRAGKPDLGMEG